ncbi:MAG: anti-sigma factor antagonist [Eubacterium sp.]|nr:anti-sigma factor antagonist [Eubacterium sp.]
MGCCHVRNQCLVIRLPGEIDHFQAEEIRKECELEFFRSLIRDIIFDFSETSFMDSSGIGLVLGRVQQIKPIQGRVFLFGGNEQIRRMWEMSGVLKYVTILESVEEMKEVYA